MKRIFELTRREQRIVIMIVLLLVAAAFAKHFSENKSRSLPPTSRSPPTSSPSIHPEEERPEQDDSR
jgi:hypothetical protein